MDDTLRLNSRTSRVAWAIFNFLPPARISQTVDTNLRLRTVTQHPTLIPTSSVSSSHRPHGLAKVGQLWLLTRMTVSGEKENEKKNLQVSPHTLFALLEILFSILLTANILIHSLRFVLTV